MFGNMPVDWLLACCHGNLLLDYLIDQDLLVTHCFGSPIKVQTLIVFYCEYSVYRAALMARHIRAEDRNANCEHYPRLTYPEIYILEGGYRGFFEEYRSRCHPQAYVEMSAPEHKLTCEREIARLRRKRKGPKAAVRNMSKHDLLCVSKASQSAVANYRMKRSARSFRGMELSARQHRLESVLGPQIEATVPV
ncbi:m-phase inducer phosphatase [Pyricularia oryzae]